MTDEPRHVATGPVSVRRTGDVLHVALQRAERANALDLASIEALLDIFDGNHLTGICGLVITGIGRNFCGGFDLSNVTDEDEATLVLRFLKLETFLQRLYHAPLVTVACVQGNAVGAGADVFAACSYRIADPECRFRMPGWRFGVALGTRRLVDRIGEPAARDVLRTARTFGASEAFELGFATHVCERAAWSPLVEAIVGGARLSAEALADLNDRTIPEHRDADMAALVASVLRNGGLKRRILDYVAEGRASTARS